MGFVSVLFMLVTKIMLQITADDAAAAGALKSAVKGSPEYTEALTVTGLADRHVPPPLVSTVSTASHGTLCAHRQVSAVMELLDVQAVSRHHHASGEDALLPSFSCSSKL
jgi:hypothetical protein